MIRHQILIHCLTFSFEMRHFKGLITLFPQQVILILILMHIFPEYLLLPRYID